MIVNPPLVTETGDITAHAEGSITLSIGFTTDLGAPRDMSARTVYFSTSTGLHQLLTAGVTTADKVLSLSQTQLRLMVNQPVDFAVVDETDALHAVHWEGKLIVRGWA